LRTRLRIKPCAITDSVVDPDPDKILHNYSQVADPDKTLRTYSQGCGPGSGESLAQLQPGLRTRIGMDLHSLELLYPSGSGFRMLILIQIRISIKDNLINFANAAFLLLCLNASILSVLGLSLLHFESPKLQNFDSNTDPDPASQNNADPDRNFAWQYKCVERVVVLTQVFFGSKSSVVDPHPYPHGSSSFW
jgi:hypothetical protein